MPEPGDFLEDMGKAALDALGDATDDTDWEETFVKVKEDPKKLLDFSHIDWDSLQKDLAPAFADTVEGFIEGTKEDTKAFGEAIARDLVNAQILGDSRMNDQLLDQLKVLAEINRVRAEPAMWALVERSIRAVVRAVVVGLFAAL